MNTIQNLKKRNQEATEKVIKLRNETTDVDMAERLGMSKVTMYKRLRTGKWKLPELALIEIL